ncbi:hypothetical protein N7468_001563 [Penicillium chermesinum]|uniref:RING-type domain-containing protein n=1 Tax=Penicillium chermesinum TaxID=63820 RepID=A0A9W9TWV9_9EURO|nr:uncharacterized protein N7468_001563 [Penicillium chermesinum]KAJ5246580.1 hypothetical protein N7468_001563 [Penicillium chermesinum]KAJ6144850.1 hypothetical protein N7470_008745 [Penicillium chermesinum]
MSRRRPSVVDLTTPTTRPRSSVGSLGLQRPSASPITRRTTRRMSAQMEQMEQMEQLEQLEQLEEMEQPVPKRRRIDLDPQSSTSSNSQEGDPPIDLTDAEETRAKQTQEAIQAQQPGEPDKVLSALGAYKCPICMDTPEDATTTACGHLFCHRCIIECLKRADQRTDDHSKQIKATCPVCRKLLTRNETSGPRRSLVPLKIKLMTKKRSAVVVA